MFTFDQGCVLSLLEFTDPKELLSPNRNNGCLLKLGLYFPSLVEEKDLFHLKDEWKRLLYPKESLKSI